MPLIKSKSKKAFEHNLKAEMEAGKPKDQSLAIAYSIQSKNKRKKMADGGQVPEEKHPMPEHEEMESKEMESKEEEKSPRISMDSLSDEEMAMIMEHRAHEASESPEEERAEHEEDELEEDHPSVAHAIMAKRKKMADGGMVDLNKNSEEDLNNEDQMSFRAGLKEQYDLDQLDPQPLDSNEHGDSIDSDEHDMVSAIRKKMASKRSK